MTSFARPPIDPTRCPFCSYRNSNPAMVRAHIISKHNQNP